MSPRCITISIDIKNITDLKKVGMKLSNVQMMILEAIYQNFCSVRLPASGMIHPQRYFTFFSSNSTAQFLALAASIKLSISLQFLDLGLLGQVISSSQGLC
jgi:hypothetical protein